MAENAGELKQETRENELKIFTRKELSALIVKKHKKFLDEYTDEFLRMKGEDQMKNYAKGRAVVLHDKEDLLNYWAESLENEKNAFLERKRQILDAPKDIEKIEHEILMKKELAFSMDEDRKRQVEWEIEKLNSEIDDLKKLMESDVAKIDSIISGLNECIQRYLYDAEESKKAVEEMQKLSSTPLTSSYQYDWLEQRVKSHEEALEFWKGKHRGYKG